MGRGGTLIGIAYASAWNEKKKEEVDVCLQCKLAHCIEDTPANHRSMKVCPARAARFQRLGNWNNLGDWGLFNPTIRIVNNWQKERRRVLMEIEENSVNLEPLIMTDEELVNSYNATLKTKAQWLDDMAQAMGVERTELRDRLKNLGIKGNTFNRPPKDAQRKSAEARKRNNAEKKAAEQKAEEQKSEEQEPSPVKVLWDSIDELKAQVADRDARIAKLERWIIDIIVMK